MFIVFFSIQKMPVIKMNAIKWQDFQVNKLFWNVGFIEVNFNFRQERSLFRR